MGRILAFVLVLSAALMNRPLAQEQQQSFKALLGRGFEIKSVAFAKGDSTENKETFVVTMQREKSVAVCIFAAPSWINLSNVALDDSKRCDVR